MLNGQKERVKNDQASIIYIVLVSEKKKRNKININTIDDISVHEEPIQILIL